MRAMSSPVSELDATCTVPKEPRPMRECLKYPKGRVRRVEPGVEGRELGFLALGGVEGWEEVGAGAVEEDGELARRRDVIGVRSRAGMVSWGGGMVGRG